MQDLKRSFLFILPAFNDIWNFLSVFAFFLFLLDLSQLFLSRLSWDPGLSGSQFWYPKFYCGFFLFFLIRHVKRSFAVVSEKCIIWVSPTNSSHKSHSQLHGVWQLVSIPNMYSLETNPEIISLCLSVFAMNGISLCYWIYIIYTLKFI